MRHLLVAVLLFLPLVNAQAELFTDVPRTHWAYEAIEKAVEAGILQGFDGKFYGARKLNRFQMAVITAKMLKRFEELGGAAGGSVDDEMVQELEALVIEFAEELSLAKVKVGHLESEIEELKEGPEKGTKTVQNIGITAFAEFALVNTDQDNGGASRYSALGRGEDSTFFDMQQVSIGIDKQVSDGLHFHAQMDFASDLNNAAGVGVNQAYFFFDELFGNVGGKLGAFAPPFSMEHNGPFRTCNLTITPSIANSYHDSFRYTGVEIQRTQDVEPGDVSWKFGVVSGTDSVGVPAFLMSDFPVNVNRAEADDGFGYYIWIGKKPERIGDWGWNFSFMDNGGDNNPGGGFTASPGGETSFFQVGFEWANDDLLVMAQYLDGSSDTGADTDFTAYYLLLNYKIDDNQSATIRLDECEWDNGVSFVAKGLTVAYNRQVTDNSIFQFEYCSPDSGDLAATDVDDDLIQLRYKVFF